MLIIDKSNYEKYLADNGADATWKKCDFVSEVEKYMDSSLSKVLLVSGLRGTGKSIGVLQAMRGRDAVYIIMEQGIHTSADEVMQVLESLTEKIIILDEYTWIENRKNSELDGFLFTLASHGKRVVVTGTESLSLEVYIPFQVNHLHGQTEPVPRRMRATLTETEPMLFYANYQATAC